MTTIEEQGFRQAVRENFVVYPEDYPTSDGDMSEEALANLRTLVQGMYLNRNEGEEQSYAAYVYAAIVEFIDYYEFEDDEEHWRFALEHFKTGSGQRWR